MKIISSFINSPEFEKFVGGSMAENELVKFPLYDPLGWIFTKRNSDDPTSFSNSAFELKYLRNESEIHVFKVLGYKDSYLFLGTLTLLSLILGIILIANSCAC